MLPSQTMSLLIWLRLLGLIHRQDPQGDEMNELAEMMGKHVEDEAEERRKLYHWFWG
jgi:predicted transcriptional regulator